MTDPRFDPAFQRGYSGPEPELVARVVVPDAAPAPDAPPVPDAVEPLAGPMLTPTPPEPPVDVTIEPESPLAIRNPYRLALLIVGVALLLIAGSTLYAQVEHPQENVPTVESQFVQLLLFSLPQAFALAGFVALLLWLVLGALDRDR
jgi:hypothetical protein